MDTYAPLKSLPCVPKSSNPRRHRKGRLSSRERSTYRRLHDSGLEGPPRQPRRPSTQPGQFSVPLGSSNHLEGDSFQPSASVVASQQRRVHADVPAPVLSGTADTHVCALDMGFISHRPWEMKRGAVALNLLKGPW